MVPVPVPHTFVLGHNERGHSQRFDCVMYDCTCCTICMWVSFMCSAVHFGGCVVTGVVNASTSKRVCYLGHLLCLGGRTVAVCRPASHHSRGMDSLELSYPYFGFWVD